MTWYVTRESVRGALDIKESARDNARIDSCIEAATDQVTGLLRRLFDPWTGTLRFDSPRGDTLWFGRRALVEFESISIDGTAGDTADFTLVPIDDGPPYDGIRTDSSTSSSLAGAVGTPSVSITGVWGYDLAESSAGTIAEALDATETGVDLDGAASAAVGVGSVIRVDDERMTVTARSQLSTGVTLSANVTASKSDTSLTLSSGAGVTQGETVMVDAEKMTIHEVAGNVVLVTRAVEGTTLAAHTSGTTLYAPRTVTVTRGALGTTAATHSTAAVTYVWRPPALVAELALAYALTALGQSQSGYARTTGSGDNERESSGRGLRQIQADAIHQYKRWKMGSV
jgi:hypothetical protein